MARERDAARESLSFHLIWHSSRNLNYTANNNGESTHQNRADIPAEPAPSVRSTAHTHTNTLRLPTNLLGRKTWMRATDPLHTHTSDHDSAGEPQGQGRVLQSPARRSSLTNRRSNEQTPQLAAQISLRSPAELALGPPQVRRAPRPHLRVALPSEAPPSVAATPGAR